MRRPYRLQFDCICLTAHDSPIGNVSVTDDPAYDREVEDRIMERLDQGDLWAWCTVKVTGTYGPFASHEYLGGCSYADTEDFERSGYYRAMQEAVIEDLGEQIHRARKELDAFEVAVDRWRRRVR